MNNETSLHQKKFYNRYWEQRKQDGHLYTDDNMWIPERILIAADMIVNNVTTKEQPLLHILDIGCGEGVLGKLLRERLQERVVIVGCDISSVALKEASAYYSELFEVDIEADDFIQRFGRQRFDYIVAVEVFEHLFEPAGALRQCHSILKDDGFLIASFPNFAWYKYRLEVLGGRFPRDYYISTPGEHIQHFTLNSFSSLLREAQFTPVAIDGLFVGPKNLGLGRFFKPLMKKFPALFGCQIVIKSKKQRKKE